MNKFPVNRTWNLNEEPQNAYYTYRQISPSLLTARVCKLRPAGQMRPASGNFAARGELRFLNRMRPANVSHVFWRCLI